MSHKREIPKALQTLEQDTLSGLVQRLRQSDTVRVHDYAVRPLAYSATNPSSGGVYRLKGSGSDRGEPLQWSLVLKIARDPTGRLPSNFPPDWGLTQEHYSYWKREICAYRSGLLNELPAGLAAPRCCAVTEQPDGTFWLWLEDLRIKGHESWSFERYERTARHLGLFNGAYLTGRRLPEADWLSRGWLRAWLKAHEARHLAASIRLAADPRTWQHPLLRQAFPRPVALPLVRLYQEREALLTALERLPPTLCHFDAYSSNLFAQPNGAGEDRTVAIDWAFVGRGAIGEESAQLLAASIIYGQVPMAQARELDTAVFASYCRGLEAAGWRGDHRQVRFAHTAAAALRWTFFIADVLKMVLNEERQTAARTKLELPLEEVVMEWGLRYQYLLDLADEAWSLLKYVGSGSNLTN